MKFKCNFVKKTTIFLYQNFPKSFSKSLDIIGYPSLKLPVRLTSEILDAKYKVLARRQN